jgi:hypothetical protein
MRPLIRTTVVLSVLLLTALAAAPAQAQASLGFGFHSWRTVDDLRSEGFGNLRRDGVSYVGSYQAKLVPLLRLEIDAEIFPKGFGGSTRTSVAPQVFLLAGTFVYGGLGVGTIYSSDFSNDFSKPFYTARVGVNFAVVPRVHVDVNGNYIVGAFNQLHNVSTGTATLGAVLRFSL